MRFLIIRTAQKSLRSRWADCPAARSCRPRSGKGYRSPPLKRKARSVSYRVRKPDPVPAYKNSLGAALVRASSFTVNSPPIMLRQRPLANSLLPEKSALSANTSGSKTSRSALQPFAILPIVGNQHNFTAACRTYQGLTGQFYQRILNIIKKIEEDCTNAD